MFIVNNRNSNMKNLNVLFFFLMMTSIVITNQYCTMKQKNQTAQYFENIEIQYENSAQKDEIIRALKDMLSLDINQLKAQRYSDYSGREGQWTLTELLNRYFVPDDSSKVPGDNFFEEVQTPEVQKIIKELLKILD